MVQISILYRVDPFIQKVIFFFSSTECLIFLLILHYKFSICSPENKETKQNRPLMDVVLSLYWGGAGMGLASHGWTVTAHGGWCGFLWLALSFFGGITIIRDSRMSLPSWWCLGKCQSANTTPHTVAEWASVSYVSLTFALDEHRLSCGPWNALLGMSVCVSKWVSYIIKFEKCCIFSSLPWVLYGDPRAS